LASVRHFKSFHSPVTSVWSPIGISTDRLQIRSSKGGAEGVGIERGQAQVTVLSASESSAKSLNQVIDFYTQGVMVLSRRDFTDRDLGKASCRSLILVISTEPAIPPEGASAPVPNIVNSDYFCAIDGHIIVVLLRNYEATPTNGCLLPSLGTTDFQDLRAILMPLWDARLATSCQYRLIYRCARIPTNIRPEIEMTAPIQPLCDKDQAAMITRTLSIVSESDTQKLDAYACKLAGCNRCYSESTGYFDFFAGKADISDRQTLCESDACPMFLEVVGLDGGQVWRCPCCDQRTRF
jgi:hypothetical protein